MIIGIDAGSTHLKTGIYSLKGDLLSIKHFRVPVYHSKPGYSEYKPEEIFCQMCRHLQEQLADSYHPAAIGISSFGESFVPMGADGSPLSDMIAWFDMRGEELINSLAEKSGTAFLYHLTGQYPSGKYSREKRSFREIRPGYYTEPHGNGGSSNRYAGRDHSKPYPWGN